MYLMGDFNINLLTCFLIVLAWPGSLFASVFLPKFCLGPGICCILIGQSQPSGVVGFKKNSVYCHYACIPGLYSWEWRRGLVVVSVTSLHPPASSNRAIKMGKKYLIKWKRVGRISWKTKNKNKNKKTLISWMRILIVAPMTLSIF